MGVLLYCYSNNITVLTLTTSLRAKSSAYSVVILNVKTKNTEKKLSFPSKTKAILMSGTSIK